MLPEWGQVGFLLLLALIFPIGGLGSSWLLGKLGVRPDRPDPIKDATYECGVETEGPAWVQFNFRYYYFALLFVIFDVEAVFLFPYAVSVERLAVIGLIEVATFVGILLIGLLYAWRKNALEWVDSFSLRAAEPEDSRQGESAASREAGSTGLRQA